MQLIKKNLILIFIIVAVLPATICFLFWPKILLGPIHKNYWQKSSAQILFVGDLMFDRGIRYYAKKGGSNEFIFDKISPLLLSNNLVVANLEGPVTNYKSLSVGTGIGDANNFVFTFDPSVAKTLFQENIRLVDLGNNHILNFGRDGVASTKKYLDEAGVEYFGAPNANKSIIKKINGIRMAFVSYNEFLSNDINSEQEAAIKEIKQVKPEADVVVVFTHWGAEYKLISSNIMQELAHKFIDAGADLIIGSHPHVIEQMEEYKGKRIYYSLGNFTFDMHFNENVRNGLGVEVKIIKNNQGGAPQMEFSEKKFICRTMGKLLKNH